MFCVAAVGLRAAEQIPPAPENHFNDYAGIVDGSAAQRLNSELAQFERDTSNQIVVAIYPKMLSDSSVSDYTTRVAQKWGAGGKARSNGAVLFIFQESHDIWIATGYGLEGALPDALCKRIIEDEIVPAFRRGNFTSGVAAGVHAMMAAAKGEYTGSGRTHNEQGAQNRRGPGIGIFAVFFVLLIVFQQFVRSRRNVLYNPRGRRGVWIGPGGGGWGGGGGGGWSGGGGGGGTFSGGGGSFGGGGAGGKW
jgi:uncharacterized protein